jgi:hypothetical protein
VNIFLVNSVWHIESSTKVSTAKSCLAHRVLVLFPRRRYWVLENVSSLTKQVNKKQKYNIVKHLDPKAKLLVGPGRGIVLPRCLPLLVVERRFINNLLQ